MPITLDQLSAAVHSFFAQKLRGAVGDTPGSIVLVFDGFGSPLPPKEFGAGATASQQQLLAHQRAAQIADQLPAANGLANGWYLPRTGGRLSFWYKALLTGSVCTSVTEQAITAFESRKASALERLEENELLEIAGVVSGAGGTVNPTGVSDSNYATGMSPTNWFLPDADSWETHRFDGTQPVPPVPSPIPLPLFAAQVLVAMPARPDPQHFPGLINWLRQAGEAVSAGDPLASIAFLSNEPSGDIIEVVIRSPATGTVLKRGRPGDDFEAGDQIAVIGLRRAPAVAAGRNALTMPNIDKPSFFSIVKRWHKAVGDDVASDELLVEIKFIAPITDDEFGNLGDLAASGITMITSGMVVIRNLQITSNWRGDERDQLTSGALNLGPFSLTGADVNGQTLTRPGAQAVGWICQVPPVLPPTSDPALPPA